MLASEILRKLGGQTAVARKLGAGRSAVSNWPRDGIPAKYWPALARLAAAEDVTRDITIDVLEKHERAPSEPAEAA
jgi:hypothetical protein